MSCDRTEKVSLLIDGELPPTEARAAERHLLECAECQELRTDFMSLRSQLDAYTPTLVPAVPRRELANLLSPRPAANVGRAERERLRGGFGHRLSPVMATVVAILLIGCAIAVTLHFRSQRRVTGLDSPTPSAVVQRPSVGPASVPSPESTVANTPPSNPEQSDETAVRKVEPKRRNTQRREAVVVVKSTNASARWPRAQRGSRSPSQPENSAAPEYVALNSNNTGRSGNAHIQAADTETLTAQHLEQSELLLRAFRNLRADSQTSSDDLSHERRKAQQLFFQNVLLRREADTAGDVQVATLLESLEPILLDIANLSERASGEDVRAIKERVVRQNLVALLQINSTSAVRGYD